MVCLLILLFACDKEPETASAEMVFHNGTIYTTVDESTNALAVSQGVVVAIGAAAKERIGDSTKVVDLGGQVAFPGFQDAHVHLLPGSFVLDRLIMVGASSMDSVLRRVSDYVEVVEPDEPWIVGFGWTPALFEEDDEPSGLALDAIVSDRPALIVDSSGHSALVNSFALDLVGIDASTPDPDGGEIVRDPTTGEPTGWLKEEALSLVSEAALSDYDDERISSGMASALEQFVSAGLTGVAEIMASPGFDVARPQIYADLEAKGELPIRIHYYTPIFAVEDVAASAAYKGQYDGDLVRYMGGKVWVDGSMGTVEAWISEPKVDDPDDFGSHFFELEDLIAITAAAEEEGIDLKWHVNGDAAIAATLDALETVSEQNGGLQQRHSFEHVVLINQADLARMQTLGVFASVQPVHYVVADLGRAPEEWGDERYGRSYDFAAFAAAGVELAMGTDWPVWPTADPLVGVWAGTNAREDAVLTAAQGLRGYTEGTAATLGFDDLGHLGVGAQADIVILDADPLEVDEGDLTDISVEAVYVGGRKVH